MPLNKKEKNLKRNPYVRLCPTLSPFRVFSIYYAIFRYIENIRLEVHRMCLSEATSVAYGYVTMHFFTHHLIIS